MKLFNHIFPSLQPTALDIQAGLTSAKDEVMNNAKFLINSIAIPIIGVFLGGLLVFYIAKAVKKHNAAEPYGDSITAIVIVIVCLTLVLSAPVWLWQLVG